MPFGLIAEPIVAGQMHNQSRVDCQGKYCARYLKKIHYENDQKIKL